MLRPYNATKGGAMPIPKEVLAVKRPTNTVVIAYGKDKDRYAVRQRVGCKNVGGRHLPINGPTIGHIVDGEFVPALDLEPVRVCASPVDLKDWAGYLLCDTLFKDILGELCKAYCRSDALKVYCICVIRTCVPGVKDYEIKEAYDTSFLSEIYPGVALSKNTVCRLLNDMGKACSRITAFMRGRAAKVGLDHHVLIDGTLKSDDSTVNSLSDFSGKAKTKGARDISLLYAFDLEAMEPICSKCFPGNMLDVTSYEAFIAESGITKGIIVADKGFPASAAERHFKKHPDLHYLNPIKRNSKLIATHGLLDFTGILQGFAGVTFRKEKANGKDKWLYSFRDASRAAKEERDWLFRAKKNDSYSLEGLRKKQATFGTVVLECDCDILPETAYKAYAERWEIEVVMRYYKSACEFDETRVQDDYSVIGSELCDFLASVLTFRLIRAFDKAELLKRMTYKKAMAVLTRAKKAKIDETGWQLIRISPSHELVLQSLGLIPKAEEPPKRKRGRPRKQVV
jgi:transposase